MAQSAPLVNHLLLADDNLLFFKASREGAEKASHLLDTYYNASGQRINRDKSSVFFGKGCPQNTRDEVKQTLNVQNLSLSDKYLGMPFDVFKYLKDRIWKKIHGWLENLLLMGGK